MVNRRTEGRLTLFAAIFLQIVQFFNEMRAKNYKAAAVFFEILQKSVKTIDKVQRVRPT